MLDILLNVISPIFIIIGAVALLSRRINIDTSALAKVILYLFAPALVLHGISSSTLAARELLQIAALALGVALVQAAIAWLVTRLMGYEKRLSSAFIMTVILVNAANYGIPLNIFAFGEAAEERAIFYYVIGVTIVNTVGMLIAARGAEASAKEALGHVLRIPLTYAGIAGLLLKFLGVEIPLPIERAVGVLGAGAVPAMLVILGLQLSSIRVRGRMQPVVLAVALKLALAPILAYAIALALGLEGVTRNVAVVQSSMPTAVMAVVIATEFKSDTEFTAAVILVSTLASIISLSILIYVLGG